MQLRFMAACRALAISLALASPTGRDSHAMAQQPQTMFDGLIVEAEQAVADRRLDRAAAVYESIRDAARERNDELWEARARYGLGTVARARGRYAEAREHLTGALEAFERLHASSFAGAAAAALGAVEYGLGNDRVSQERYAQAMTAFEAAGNRLERARAQLGWLRADLPTDVTAKEATYAALIAEARRAGEPAFEAAILHSWGDRLFAAGDYERASEQLQAAARVADSANVREELATIYTSLGRLYRVHGQPQAAVTYQLKALELSDASASPRMRVQSLNAVGVAYEASGDFVKAREYLERALALAGEVGSPAIVDFLQAQLGGLLMLAGDADRARPLLEGVVARGIEQHRALRLTQLAGAYYGLGRFDEARAAAMRAIELCPADTPTDCVFGHLQLAKAELALGHQPIAQAEEAAALKELEVLHGKLVATDFLKQEFHHYWEPVYSLGIRLHFAAGELRGALETAELARARGFVDLLASHDLTPAEGAVPQFAGLTRRRDAPTTVRSATSIDAPDATALSSIVARLRSTLLEYWVADDAVYIWTVAANGTVHGAVARISRFKLEQLVRATSAFAGDGGGSEKIGSRGDGQIPLVTRNTTAWRELYDLLVKPIERELPRRAGARLTIVAHGPLMHLPFAALRDADGRYLIERFTIHSAPAAAALEFTAGRRHADARAGKLLLVADPAAPTPLLGEPPLPRLPGSRDEATAIARLVPPARATLLADGDATEDRVRAALPSRSAVHFATHAIVRNADPMGSFLALGRTRDGDGRLTAEKIYGMKLDTDLVVLSACRSGDGVVTGDGVAALARAFFYAGAPSVVVSLWDVADAPTSRLLPAFYREWLSGADKAGALRRAQLQLIHDLRAGQVTVATAVGTIAIPEDPAFWAGFVLLGEPD